MCNLEAVLITEKSVLELEVDELNMVRFLLKVTRINFKRRNMMRNRYLQKTGHARKIGCKVRCTQTEQYDFVLITRFTRTHTQALIIVKRLQQVGQSFQH